VACRSKLRPVSVRLAKAAPKGAVARFRAIPLILVTTIVGVMPLYFEASFQAQILIHLVASIAFGLIATTVLIVFVVPPVYAILDDLGETSVAAERQRVAATCLATRGAAYDGTPETMEI
jgi:HAE1 family hydrophobic/amphiphilic exporter-1